MRFIRKGGRVIPIHEAGDFQALKNTMTVKGANEKANKVGAVVGIPATVGGLVHMLSGRPSAGKFALGLTAGTLGTSLGVFAARKMEDRNVLKARDALKMSNPSAARGPQASDGPKALAFGLGVGALGGLAIATHTFGAKRTWDATKGLGRMVGNMGAYRAAKFMRPHVDRALDALRFMKAKKVYSPMKFLGAP